MYIFFAKAWWLRWRSTPFNFFQAPQALISSSLIAFYTFITLQTWENDNICTMSIKLIHQIPLKRGVNFFFFFGYREELFFCRSRKNRLCWVDPASQPKILELEENIEKILNSVSIAKIPGNHCTPEILQKGHQESDSRQHGLWVNFYVTAFLE